MNIITKRCSKCKREFPATPEYFQRTKRTKDGFHVWCKPCKRDYAKIQGKKNYQAHRKERLAYAKERHYLTVDKQHERSKKYYATHKELSNQRVKENSKKNRLDVIQHYGGKCVCCGETQIEFLAMDHINGGGRKHRASIKNSNMYRWIKKNGYPNDFQILCHNCNMAKGFYGQCPHQK